MILEIAGYIIVFIVLVILSRKYIKTADHFNIIDNPNHRSSHTEPTIRGGGIIFYFAVLFFFILSGFEYLLFFIAITLLAVVSFLDDIFSLSKRLRLVVHFTSAILLLWQLQLLDANWLVLVSLSIMIVGFYNLYNFMDGINGLTAIYSMVVISGFLSINNFENIIDNRLLVYLLLSLVVFSFYNLRKKAKWFAGDIGSITIAACIFFFGVLFIKTLHAPIIILFIVVYAVDAILTIALRVIRGEKITEAHRHHLYQKFVDVGNYPHTKVAFLYGAVQIIINVLVIYFYKSSIHIQYIIIVSTCLGTGLLYLILIRYFNKKGFHSIKND
ncbi:MAG: UDP-GlcNAc--UDP-phosphate GlcNAc-1-phosphate transferase [Flavobacteriales bacterium]|nr:MAG: UDP-GlcNAc--UDP-phosphate GlcNAc-1-phosphate transferase [Flavobacteriales bacterium]